MQKEIDYSKALYQKNTKDNVAENLSKLFEKMVFQLEMVTDSFKKFDGRLSNIEDMVEEIKAFETESNIGENILNQKKIIENEFEEQMEQMQKVRKNMNLIQENFMGNSQGSGSENNFEYNNNNVNFQS